MKRVNEMLLRLTDPYAHIEYDLMQPFDAYQKIESLVYGAARTHRVVLIPLGPKMFSALSVMLGIDNYPDVCVWRVSGGDYELPTDRKASGLVACIDFIPPELSNAIAEPAFST